MGKTKKIEGKNHTQKKKKNKKLHEMKSIKKFVGDPWREQGATSIANLYTKWQLMALDFRLVFIFHIR